LGAANLGAGGSNTRDFLTVGQSYRVRQNGTISRVRLCTVNKPVSMTGFYIKIWRADGSAYDLVGTSNNIVNDLVAGSCTTIDLSTPITGVQEGDYYGYRTEDNGGAYTHYALTEQTGVTTYYADDVVPDSNDYNWVGGLSLSGVVIPVELYMTAPQIAFIGDSIIAGHPAHYNFLETTATTDINSTIEKQFSNLTGYTYQNMGIGSQTTTNIATRFTADILNLKPRIVVIEGGVNDVAGSVEKATFISNWTSMLDAAQADSSITTIMVIKILPWTNGSTIQMQTRDDWNSSLATLAAGYSKAIVVDASSYVGEFRAGGDLGNLWNIQAAYDADGVHFNQAGHTQIAQAIADNLPKPSATFDNDFSSWNSGNITVNYNLIQVGGSTNSNISQTATSGIEYSTDNSSWNDATQGSGGDGLTGLIGTTSPGTNHAFVWNSTTDLPTTEDSTVYLRIRPNNGSASATDWIASNAFALDNVAPSSVGAPTFGTITSSSIEIIEPATVTEGGTLNQWQVRKNGTTELGLNATSTTVVTDSSLSENTQYAYAAQFNDNAGNTSTYGTSAQKYTLTDTPTNLSASSVLNSTTLSVDSFPNDTSDQSGYYFSRAGVNSGWIQTNSWTDTEVTCNNSYTYSVKYRNGDGTETDEISITELTSACGGGGGGSALSPALYQAPIAPIGGFKIVANQGAPQTYNRIINLNFNANSDVIKMAISFTGNFDDANQEYYSPTKQIDLCSKFGGLIKNPTCPSGQYTIYVKFYTLYGQVSNTVATKINLIDSASATTLTKDLNPGSTDSQIKILQQFLNQNGFKLADSGVGSIGRETNYFGQLTSVALGKFQEANQEKIAGLSNEKGYLGPLTRELIKSLTNTTATTPVPAQTGLNLPSAVFTAPLYKNMQSENVRRLQIILASKPEIYPEGLVTGYFGLLTEKAVQAFQLKYGVVNSKTDTGFGVVGPKTRTALQEVFGN
jgi:lysophospholipase L1-like esterase/peptidoglycan hydrolase-like protein with peptidoglycan-binding domain